MDIGIISIRYARALISYATDYGVEDKVYKEFLRLEHSYSKFPELRTKLDNPILTRKEKFQLICVAANGENESSREFVRFIRLVLRHHREFYLRYIVLSFLELYRKAKNIGVGILITAAPVDTRTEEKIRKIAGAYLHAKMELHTIVDPTIEGGFIFDINGFRLDASVATQLKRVKQQFIERNKRIV